MCRRTDKKDPESLAQGPVLWLLLFLAYCLTTVCSQWDLVHFCASLYETSPKFEEENSHSLLGDSWRHFKAKGPAESRQVGWSQAHHIFEELLQSDLVKLIYLVKNSLWRTSHSDLGWSERRTGHLLVGMMLDTGPAAGGELERHQVAPLGEAEPEHTFLSKKKLGLCLWYTFGQTSMSCLDAFYFPALNVFLRSLEAFERSLTY